MPGRFRRDSLAVRLRSGLYWRPASPASKFFPHGKDHHGRHQLTLRAIGEDQRSSPTGRRRRPGVGWRMSAWNVDSLNRSPDGWNELGVRRALQGDWWTARDCFERAVADRGDVVEFWANLGMASVRLHDEDTGRGAFEVSEV